MRKCFATSLFAVLILAFTAGPALGQSLAINEFLADPNSTDNNVDLNNDGTADSDDEFVEIFNTGATPIDISGYQIDDEVDGSPPYTFPEGTTIDPNEGATVIGGLGDGGNLNGIDGGFADVGLPGLNNTGDDIRLFDDQGTLIQVVSFGENGSTVEQDGISSARNPNGEGDFAPQNTFGTMTNESAGRNNNDGDALPVEFAGAPLAAVNGRDVTLRWTTQTEVNNLGFFAQHRRAGASTWITAPQRVDGAGNSSAEQDYGYTVRGLAPGRYVFRVQQVDTDDTKSYSQEVEATVRAEGFALEAPSQNPFRGRTVLTYSAEGARNVEAVLYNSLGQQVRTLRPSAGRIEVEAGSLSSGLYFVRLTDGDRSEVQSITLIR